MTQSTGWKPMPMPLKILSVVMLLWAVGAVMNLPNLMTNGLPLMGTFVYATTALLIVLALDFIGPLVFLFALWTRKSWGPKWAFSYLGLFILNSVVAFFTVRDQLGTPQIIIPTLAAVLFLMVIYWKRDYFVPRS